MSIVSIMASIYDFYLQFYQIIFYTWPFLFVIILFVLKRRWAAYPLDAVIIEKRGDNLIKTNDRIGRKLDKYTGMISYRLLKAKDSIPVMDFEWVLHNKPQATNFFEKIVNLVRATTGTVFLFRYGSKQYKPIYINKKDSGRVAKLVPIKNEKGEKNYIYQYSQFDPRWVLGALDFDVIDWDNMNFMVQEQRASIERRRKKGDKLMQMIIPITIIAASVVVSIFILKFSYDAGAGLNTGAPTPTTSENGGGGKIIGAIGGAVTPGG